MDKWVKCLCQVCGLTKDELQDEVPGQVSPSHSSTSHTSSPSQYSLTGHGAGEGGAAGYTPEPVVVQQSPSYKVPRQLTPAHQSREQHQSSPPTHTVPTSVSSQRTDEYFPISEFYSHKENNNTKPNTPHLLDKVPPAPGKDTALARTGSCSSIPEEVAPLPPKTPREEPMSPHSMYDRPKHPYYSPDDQEANFYKVPNPNQPISPTADGGAGMDYYQSPGKARSVEQNNFYDKPRSLGPAPVMPTHSPHKKPVPSRILPGSMQYHSPPKGVISDFYDTPRPQGPGQALVHHEHQEVEGELDDSYDIPPARTSPHSDKGHHHHHQLYDAPTRPARGQEITRSSGSSNSSRSSHKNDSAYHSEEPGESKQTSADDLHNPQDFYDVPKPLSSSTNNMLEKVPPPPRPDRSAKPRQGSTSTYMNIGDSSAQQSWNSQSQPNMAVFDDTYDVPKPRDQEVLMKSPPPCAADVDVHRYVNTGQDFYIPMFHNVCADGGGDMYTDMQSRNMKDYTNLMQQPGVPNRPPRTDSTYAMHPSNIPVTQAVVPPRTNRSPRSTVPPAGLHDDDLYVIKPTKRTQSFKRRLDSSTRGPNGNSSDVKLPVRKQPVSEESSSEDVSDDNSSSTASVDNVHGHAPSRAPMEHPPPYLRRGLDSTPPPPKMEKRIEYLDLRDTDTDHNANEPARGQKKPLNVTPPAPKREHHLQYLELSDQTSDPERSPNLPHTRSPPAHPGGLDNKTEYKEIDFIRTKALSETKRSVENERKSSETDK